jgi:hypothetical protein
MPCINSDIKRFDSIRSALQVKDFVVVISGDFQMAIRVNSLRLWTAHFSGSGSNTRLSRGHCFRLLIFL